MVRYIGSLCLCLVFVTPCLAENTLKVGEQPIPKELSQDIAKLLQTKSIGFMDAKGNMVARFWFRKTVPTKLKGAEANKKSGYRDIAESTILGVVEILSEWQDYRTQPLPKGVYTMRLGYQPQDGDHMGTAPHPEFCVLIAAKYDPKGEPMDTKGMVQRSAFSIKRSHPAVLLLFPAKSDNAAPKLEERPGEHVVLLVSTPTTSGGTITKGSLPMALTVVGHANE